MDEMKVKLSTKLMRGIVSKLLSGLIYKQFGYRVGVRLDELDVNFTDGETTVLTKVELKLESAEFVKIMDSFNLT